MKANQIKVLIAFLVPFLFQGCLPDFLDFSSDDTQSHALFEGEGPNPLDTNSIKDFVGEFQQLRIYGAPFSQVNNGVLEVNRFHSEDFVKFNSNNFIGMNSDFLHYQTQSSAGTYIEFSSNSPQLKFEFNEINDGMGIDGVYTLLENGVEVYQSTKPVFEFTGNTSDEFKDYQLFLPFLVKVQLIKAQAAFGEIKKVPLKEKPIVIYIGDSNTQASTGFISSSEVLWGRHLAHLRDTHYWNLAVSGSTINPYVLNSIQHISIQDIFIAFGVNSFQLQKPISIFKTQYKNVLALLNEYSKESQIYCVTPIVNDFTNASHFGDRSDFIPLENYRMAIRDVCASHSIIEGKELSNKEWLNTDKVHLDSDYHPIFAQKIFERYFQNMSN